MTKFIRIIKGFVSGKSSTQAPSSDFSHFFREASSADKKKVFLRVARQATEDQKKILKVN